MGKTKDIFEKMTHKAAKRMEADTVNDERWWSTAAPLIEAEMTSTGVDEQRAGAVVANRLKKSGTQVLGLLGYPPEAMHGLDLKQRLDGMGMELDEQVAVINGLEFSGQIGEINQWWSRVPELTYDPATMSHDDIAWLLGGGRFSQ